MPKEKMQVRLKSYFKPEKGQYGMSQGSYIVTDKGEFNCYNSGPEWFGMNEKGQIIEVLGEWKQSQQTQDWYLTCTYGQVVNEPPTQSVPQGGQWTPPQERQAPQNAPQAPPRATGRPSNNKDRLIVAQVVYKVLAEVHCCEPTNPGEFDVWLMGNQNVFKRHVDLIIQVGAGTLPSGQTEPDAPEPDEFDEAMSKPY